MLGWLGKHSVIPFVLRRMLPRSPPLSSGSSLKKKKRQRRPGQPRKVAARSTESSKAWRKATRKWKRERSACGSNSRPTLQHSVDRLSHKRDKQEQGFCLACRDGNISGLHQRILQENPRWAYPSKVGKDATWKLHPCPRSISRLDRGLSLDPRNIKVARAIVRTIIEFKNPIEVFDVDVLRYCGRTSLQHWRPSVIPSNLVVRRLVSLILLDKLEYTSIVGDVKVALRNRDAILTRLSELPRRYVWPAKDRTVRGNPALAGLIFGSSYVTLAKATTTAKLRCTSQLLTLC